MKSLDKLRVMELYEEVNGPYGYYYREVDMNLIADEIENEIDEEIEKLVIEKAGE